MDASSGSLKATLTAQEGELTLLLQALEAERELLCAAQPDGAGLLEAAEAKSRRLETLGDLEETLNRAQTRRGFPAGVGGRLSAACEAGCVDLLHRVNDATHRVFRLNQQNGELLKQRMTLNRKILAFMRDAQGTVTYSASGRTGGQRTTIRSRA